MAVTIPWRKTLSAKQAAAIAQTVTTTAVLSTVEVTRGVAGTATVTDLASATINSLVGALSAE